MAQAYLLMRKFIEHVKVMVANKGKKIKEDFAYMILATSIIKVFGINSFLNYKRLIL